MWLQTKRRYVYYLKTAGTCAVFLGTCWALNQLRQISHKLGSAVATNILQLEQSQAQYIYLDDPQLADVIFQNNIDLQYFIRKNQESMLNKITARWKSLILNCSFMSLQLAQMGSTKALYSLGLTKNLKDWHYNQMAQMLDAKTAIALARIPNVDLRFFLKPPYSHIKHDLWDLIQECHYMLTELNTSCNDRHLCLSQFLSKHFTNSIHDGSIFEHDLVSVGLVSTPRIIYDLELLENCIFAIYHHSSLEQCSKDIINAGGLALMMKIQTMYGDNLNICILLAKILSNISFNVDALDAIYQSGWIGVLAKWARHEDVRLSVTAGKALANLDANDNRSDKFSQDIYLLHPLHRMHGEQKLDVIFIHGLLGGVFITWRQRDIDLSDLQSMNLRKKKEQQDLIEKISETSRDFLKDLVHDFRTRDQKTAAIDNKVISHDCFEYTKCTGCDRFSRARNDFSLEDFDQDENFRTNCWPKDWLSVDTPNIRVIGIDYTSNLSMWTPFCPVESMKRTIKDRSDELIWKLSKAGIGKRPIIWVCHSMGGLLVKKMLLEEWKNNDENGFCRNTRGIVFYSTPHRGSYVAALAPATKMLLWPSIEVQELRESNCSLNMFGFKAKPDSPELLKMHTSFLELLKNFCIDIVTFSETKSTIYSSFNYHFVTPESADPGVGQVFPISQDHLTICKPANRDSFLYQKILSMVKHYIAVS